MLYWANWMARDEDGTLKAYATRPKKETGKAGVNDGKWVVSFDEHQTVVDDPMGKYAGIKWIDEHPTHIVWDRTTGSYR